jgi:hypothetical protein
LIVALCGSCRFQVIRDMVAPLSPTAATGDRMIASDGLGGIATPLVIGGVPTLIGLYLVWRGLRVLRRGS